VSREATSMTISRRGFLGSSAALAGAAMFAPRAVFAQEAQQPEMVINGRKTAAAAKITTQKLRGGVYALMGSGGNIAVLPGPQGKVLVDAGISTSRPQIMEALNGISADPITHLINTHWHWDHTDGNEWVHAAGATIIAQEKTKARLSAPQHIALFNATFPAAPQGAIPTLTFGEKDHTKLNGVTLSMTHYEPAHTDTDISVSFVEADVLHTGDTWFNGIYPFIDYSTGGSIGGMIKAADRNLAASGADTILIPGHGPIGNRKQLQEYRDVLVVARDKVAALKQQGKTVAEVVTAKPLAEYDTSWGGGFMKPEVFLGLVYQGV
jgi:glyoxylase-like metal-dependent hydrolase (beta-lactamase superfamily II)